MLFYDISINHQNCLRGKGEEVVIFFHERNERYRMQRKLLGVPSTFGRHCISRGGYITDHGVAQPGIFPFLGYGGEEQF